jgi:REP element-mobilizing transposase RayT
MLPKYEYRRRLPHYQKDDYPLFVTFTTDRRWELPAAARDAVLECCLQENGHQFDLHAAVVMPDHVHLIYSPLRRDNGWSYTLPEMMKAIKGRSARMINVALLRSGPVWQEGFSDHRLRSNERVVDRVEYVCQNPVRAGWREQRASTGGESQRPFRPPDRVKDPVPHKPSATRSPSTSLWLSQLSLFCPLA